MSTAPRDETLIEPAHAGRLRAAALPLLCGVGTAVPEIEWAQERTLRFLADLWGLSGSRAARFERIVRGAGIERRRAAAPVEDVVHLTTAERMRIYERTAPALAEAAARRALDDARIDAEEVTDLVVVSCTGFSAPGVDAALVERLGLSRGVRRTVVGFMGCFGGISGLRTAAAACCADPKATALVVCVELCTLHLRADGDVQNQVASALFGDGAAAAVVRGRDVVSHDAGACGVDAEAQGDRAGCGVTGCVSAGASLLIPEGAEWMTWRVTDAGFAMTLTRDVPRGVEGAIGAFLEDAYGDVSESSLVVHPGGPGILDAVERGANRAPGGVDVQCARDVLRRHGNMSSGTVFFVLEEMVGRGARAPLVLLAFGPGLSVESILISDKNN